jgi:hypothetical protein
MVLNLCRDSNFDSIPSYVIQRTGRSESDNIDLSYWQVKEFKKQIPKGALMSKEFVNAYG